MGSKTILVFSENPTLLRQLVGKAYRQARELGWKVSVVDFGKEGTTLGEMGVDVIYQVNADKRDPETVISVLTAVAHQVQPVMFLIGATKLGMEVAPRLAERLDAGYAAWAVDFEIDKAVQAITAQCMLYTGMGLATYRFKPGMLILTAAQDVFESSLWELGKKARIEALDAPEVESKIKILDYKPKQTGGARLEEAKCILDVGQGMKERDDLQMVRSLAKLLDGQLACTRPIASDRDWFPEWLGLSGAKVKPALCLTIGISGAIQHIVGIRDSHLIVAVNNDEGAPIFSQADYGVVADLYEFLPAFIERIKARNIRSTWIS